MSEIDKTEKTVMLGILLLIGTVVGCFGVYQCGTEMNRRDVEAARQFERECPVAMRQAAESCRAQCTAVGLNVRSYVPSEWFCGGGDCRCGR